MPLLVPHPARCRRRPQGQALAELLVAAAVLVPMLLLFPLVYKYIDMMQATEQASRYVAFEGTVHTVGSDAQKSDAVLTTEVARRFFSRSGTQMLSGEGYDGSDDERLPLWDDLWGRPMVDAGSKVGVQTEVAEFNSVPLVSFLAHGEFKLPKRRVAIGRVSVDPENLPDLPPFDALNLRWNRVTAVMADPWAATGVDDARGKYYGMRYFNPLVRMQQLEDFTGQMPTIISDDVISGDGFWGNAAWYLLPCDRLENGCN